MDEDNPGGGAAQDDTAAPEVNPAVQELIKAAVAKETAGLVSKRDELLREAKKAKDERAAIIAQVGGEEGIEEYLAWKKKIDSDEEMKHLKNGDLNSLKDKWLKRSTDDFNKQLKAKDEIIAEITDKNNSLQARLHKEIIGNQVRSAALSIPDIQSSAVDSDITAAALATFSLNDEGQMIARDGSGELLFGKDGKNIAIKEWLESLRDTRPHWYQAPPSGAGIKGSTGRLSGVDLSKMSPVQRMEYARQHGLR